MCTPNGREFIWAHHENIDLLTWRSVVWGAQQGSGRGALFFIFFYLHTSKTLQHYLLATVVNMHFDEETIKDSKKCICCWLFKVSNTKVLFFLFQGGLLSDGSSHSPGLWTSYTLHLFVQHSKPHTRPFAKVLMVHLIILLSGTHLKHVNSVFSAIWMSE